MKWKTWLLGISGVVFLALIVFAVVGDNGYLEWRALRNRRASLETQVHQLEETNARLAKEIHALKTDYASIERYAREQLGWVKEGETIYLLPNQQKSSPHQ